MAYTETTSQGWLGRLGNSIKGIVVGIVFVLGGIGLLFWGEGRAVKRAKALDEGAATVISVSADAPQPGNEGKLVHVSGRTETYDEVRDDVFGIVTHAVKLERRVEMYQWQEHKESEERKKLGGGTETVTTYTYDTTWAEGRIDSGSFKQPDGHENPSLPFSSETFVADPVVIGDWILSDPFVSQLSQSTEQPITETDLSGVSSTLRGRLTVTGGRFYLPSDSGSSGASPEVGDVRIAFQVVPHATVSVVGRQVSQSLMSYEARTGSLILLLDYGTVGAAAMFETAKKENTVLTWILRLVGFVLVFIGFAAVFKPFSVVADVVPLFGNIVEAGTTFIAFVLAAIVSLVTIAVGWIVYRPLLGITLLVVVGFLVWWMFKKLKTSERAIQDKWTGGGPAGGTTPPPPGSLPPPPPPPR